MLKEEYTLVINDLKRAYNRLSWYKKLFFPRDIREAIKKLPSESAQYTGKGLKYFILIFRYSSGWFKNFFHCLRLFKQSTLFKEWGGDDSRIFMLKRNLSQEVPLLSEKTAASGQAAEAPPEAALHPPLAVLKSIPPTPAISPPRGFNYFSKDCRLRLLENRPLAIKASLACSSRANYDLFQPGIQKAKEALPLLTLVVEGDVDKLKKLVADNPKLLFSKSEVTDAGGRVFYNASAFQLMLFLCDGDMYQTIVPLIPLSLEAERKRQYFSMRGGGADLVKLNQDPLTAKMQDLLQVLEEFRDQVLKFPLLENPDGIVFYQDNLYYVNQATDVRELIQGEPEKLAEVKALFSDMIPNSSRRSSDEEYRLIVNITAYKPTRRGICYQQNGVFYRDCQDEFAYLKIFREYGKLIIENQNRVLSSKEKERLSEYRVTKLGLAMRILPAWLLQHLCADRPFHPQVEFEKALHVLPFVRKPPEFFNENTGKREILLLREPNAGLGYDYSLYKGFHSSILPRRTIKSEPFWDPEMLVDLLAIHALQANSRETIIKTTPAEVLCLSLYHKEDSEVPIPTENYGTSKQNGIK